MSLMSSILNKIDPERGRIRGGIDCTNQQLGHIAGELKAMRKFLMDDDGALGKARAKMDCMQCEINTLYERLDRMDNVLATKEKASLSIRPSIFNILLVLFFVLVIFGSSVVLNPAESLSVFDYILYNLPIVAAISAGLGLYVRKNEKLKGLPADGFFFCLSVLFLLASSIIYAVSRSYLEVMVFHASGACPAIFCLWALLLIRNNFDRSSSSHVAILLCSIFSSIFAFCWIYVINEYKPGSYAETLSLMRVLISSLVFKIV
ncbi:hypothetical protein [Xanthomonas axonopodis]